MTNENKAEAVELTKPVLVIGEVCKDIFCYGGVKRISPEAPVPVFEASRTESSYGMAWNVVSQLEEFGMVVVLNGAPHYGLEDSDFFCGTKRRYVDLQSDQHLLRVDDPNTVNKFSLPLIENLIKSGSFSAVVVSDYDKGLLDLYILTAITTLCLKQGIPTFIDTKQTINKDTQCVFSKFDYVKLNDEEFKRAESLGVDFSKFKGVLHTQGSAGATGYWSEPFRAHSPQSPKVSHAVFDVCGAGDFFTAAFVYHMLKFKNKHVALTFAVDVASLSVSKRGCDLVRMSELNFNYPFKPDDARNPLP